MEVGGRRGVSEIIATVILIAIVIAAGVILYGYSRGILSAESSTLDFQVSPTLSASYGGVALLEAQITNTGATPISTMTVTLTTDTSSNTYSLTNLGLGPGAVTTLQAASINTPPAQVTGGRVGGWEFNEMSGTEAFDSTANGDTGTLGCAGGSGCKDPAWVSGLFGGALQFSAAQLSYVDLGTSSVLNPSSDLSITLAVYPMASGATFALVDHSPSYTLELTSADNVEFCFDHSATPYCTPSSATIPLNKWSTIGMSYDATAGGFFVINSVLDSASITAHGTIDSNSAHTYIGYSSVLKEGFTGRIDTVNMYSVALSQTYIGYNFAQSEPYTPSSNLDVLWKFNEGYGTTVYDASDQQNSISIASANTWVPGVSGTAVDFNGAGSAFSLSSPFHVQSVSLWFKTTSTAGTLMCLESNSALDTWEVSPIGFNIYTGGVTYSFTNFPSLTYNNGNWHFIAVTENSTGASLFYDGKLYTDPTMTHVAANPMTGGYWNGGCGHGFGDFGGAGVTEDDVAAYSTRLTLSQMQQMYSAQSFNIAGGVTVGSTYVLTVTVVGANGDQASKSYPVVCVAG